MAVQVNLTAHIPHIAHRPNHTPQNSSYTPRTAKIRSNRIRTAVQRGLQNSKKFNGIIFLKCIFPSRALCSRRENNLTSATRIATVCDSVLPVGHFCKVCTPPKTQVNYHFCADRYALPAPCPRRRIGLAIRTELHSHWTFVRRSKENRIQKKFDA